MHSGGSDPDEGRHQRLSACIQLGMQSVGHAVDLPKAARGSRSSARDTSRVREVNATAASVGVARVALAQAAYAPYWASVSPAPWQMTAGVALAHAAVELSGPAAT